MRWLRFACVALPLGLGAIHCAPSADSAAESGQAAAAGEEAIAGPMVNESTASEVWSVDNAWEDTDTPAAKAAGPGWEANSGLTWEQKYNKWVGSFERVRDADGSNDTVLVTTPDGRKAQGPSLECADFAVWLRLTFASFYHLPFYLTRVDGGRRLFFGHFGVVDQNGNPAAGYPKFSTIKSYEGQWTPGQAWPSDPVLRAKSIGKDDSSAGIPIDGTPLPAGSRAGTYYDQVYLNKRVGYLAVLMDAPFGSIQLADRANTFDIQAEAVTAGDVLVHRHDRGGAGHATIVMRSDRVEAPAWMEVPFLMRIQLADGGLPRQQPEWKGEALAPTYFTSSSAGGPGQNDMGDAWVSLGGGLKRWYAPAMRPSGGGQRWYNVPSKASAPSLIAAGDKETLMARIAKFQKFLAPLSPEQGRDWALGAIEQFRDHLRKHPSSCMARIRREDAFHQLQLAGIGLQMSRQDVDFEWRKLEDFVFAELDYDRSKTCCWNSTTKEMGEIVLRYAHEEYARAKAASECREPTVFKAHADGEDGYKLWRDYAKSIGMGAAWVAWSTDEECGATNGHDDGESGFTPKMCPKGVKSSD